MLLLRQQLHILLLQGQLYVLLCLSNHRVRLGNVWLAGLVAR